MQSLSGTGALLLAGMALKRANPAARTIYITNPTWPNHELLFETMGFSVQHLAYYNSQTRSFDAEKFLDGLKTAEPSSPVIFHACAHNPTGCDPSHKQWSQIADVVRTRNLFPVFDSAYLGFNSGNVDKDAWAIRYFTEELGMEAAVCMSFSKSMGLYGERAGAVMFVAATPELSLTMQSILENAQRATISTPPLYGARIAEVVLRKPEIRKQWADDLLTMSGRIATMRGRLFEELQKLGQGHRDWDHIVKQTGMFSYLGISPDMVEYLESKSTPSTAAPDDGKRCLLGTFLTSHCRGAPHLHGEHVAGFNGGFERAQRFALRKGAGPHHPDFSLESGSGKDATCPEREICVASRIEAVPC